MHQYETIYILNAELDEETKTGLVTRINALLETNGAELTKLDEWGKRRLAYPINDMQDGYYVLMNFTSAPEFPEELERNFRIMEEVLRYLVIRLDD